MDLFLTTAFVFMACDGEIVQEEINLIKSMAEQGLIEVDDIDEQLHMLTNKLNTEGKSFFKDYLYEVGEYINDNDNALKLLRIAVDTIYADNVVEYSEVKFFRAVRSRLRLLDDETILNTFPEVEDFWLESDVRKDAFAIEKDYFDNIQLPMFDLTNVSKKNNSN